MVYRACRAVVLCASSRRIGALRTPAAQYAPLLVVRLGPTFPMIVATSPESAKDILGTGGPNKKSDIYKMLHPWLAQGLLTSEKPKWKARRTLLTPSFHFSMLESYVRVFQIHARHMLAHLEGLTRKPQSRFHIYPVFTHVALDIVRFRPRIAHRDACAQLTSVAQLLLPNCTDNRMRDGRKCERSCKRGFALRSSSVLAA